MRFSKSEIRTRLEARVKKKEPILVGGAGLGLIGVVEEMADVDMIMTCASDHYRMDGRPSAIAYYMFGSANNITLNIISKRVNDRVKKTPLIAGITACDPYWNQERLLDEVERLGYSGIINAPANYSHGEEMEIICRKTGYHMTFAADVDMIKRANDRGLFTIAYVFTKEQAAAMAEAGADIVCPHAGLTVWKLGPDPEDARTLEDAIAFTGELTEAAKAANRGVYVLCHGGPFNSPDKVQKCFDETDVDGFIGTSAFDSQPMYEAIVSSVKEYKKSREIYASMRQEAEG
ncbi:MAG: phosphoenolpyruvate hydrolase family protein [Lachnospiraceae bacterium]|nr:phosphoenolpyruvate hydrolase family protein [Lachnospiraceae bacterium]